MEENIFPVSFKDFRMDTNVREVVLNSLTKKISIPEKEYKKQIRNFEYSVYNTYFQDFKGRSVSPQRHIKIDPSCSEEKRSLYLQRINYPVSFEEFKKFTNVMELAESLVLKGGKVENNLTKVARVAIMMYQNYYTLPDLRNNSLQFKTCSSEMKEKLMAYASFHTTTDVAKTVQEKNTRTLLKRKRSPSPEVGSTTENTPEDECLTKLSQKPPSQHDKDTKCSKEAETQTTTSQNFLLVKSASLPEDFLTKYVDAYLERKKTDILKQLRTTVQKSCKEFRTELTKNEKYLRLKSKGPIKIKPLSYKTQSELELNSLQTFFETNDKFYSLSQSQTNNNELYNKTVRAICEMRMDEFRYYTCIYGAPIDIYSNQEILECCYNFVMKNPKVWPLNLYIGLKDLLRFLKTKHVSHFNEYLKDISPKLLIWSDLVTLTNFDECAFSKGLACRHHKYKNRQLFYKVCWTHDRWIGSAPRIIDRVMIQEVGIQPRNIVTNIKTEPVNQTLLKRITFELTPDENSFYITDAHDSIISIEEDKLCERNHVSYSLVVNNKDAQNVENEEKTESSILGESIKLYHQCIERFIVPQNRERILESKKIFYFSLTELCFFENLSTAQIVRFNLKSTGMGQRFVEAIIDCNEKMFIYSLNFFKIFLSPLTQISSTVLSDLETILLNVNEYYYNKHKYIILKRSLNSCDIREKVLSSLLTVLPRFCACNLISQSTLYNAAICLHAERNLNKAFYPKLPAYIRPFIRNKIRNLKSKK